MRLLSAALRRSSASWRRECRPLMPDGLFQQDAALGGLRIDDRADAALADERGGMRAGRGIGEEQLHVARAHFAAVDAVVRAHAALDAADDLDLGDLVIRLRRVAIADCRATSDTSARLRAGRPLVPPKMTSSISPPRMRLAEFSPIAQRSASTRFDLPQPFGPTMPVTPASMRSSVGSTKDLKPLSLNFANCISAEPAFDFVEDCGIHVPKGRGRRGGESGPARFVSPASRRAGTRRRRPAPVSSLTKSS